MAPTLGKITRHNGIAGQYCYSTVVTYDGERPRRIDFVANVYGSPIVMVDTSTGYQTTVDSPDRFGKFGPEWVRRFFGS